MSPYKLILLVCTAIGYLQNPKNMFFHPLPAADLGILVHPWGFLCFLSGFFKGFYPHTQIQKTKNNGLGEFKVQAETLFLP